MGAWGKRAGACSLLFVMTPACNGQFDFDTTPLDAGEPRTVPEGGGPDDASTGDRAIDIPRPGLRIACGASDCLGSACCIGQNGAMSCVAAEGGTCSGLLIQCDDTDDCAAGQVCCAEEGVSPSPSCLDTSDCSRDLRPRRVHCEPESHCREMNFVILCNPNRPSPCTQCVATTLTGLPPGYHQCPAAP